MSVKNTNEILPASLGVGRKMCSRPWQQISLGVDGFVTPCCSWRGGQHSVPPLGNVNNDPILTIWNGPEYQKLREAFVTGNLEGLNCPTCQEYIFNGNKFPEFHWPGMFSVENGFCWIGKIPVDLLRLAQDSAKPILLLEDGVPMPCPESLHAEIRTKGAGRYSVWGKYAYFSSTDNSNPIVNGRTYSFVCGGESRPFMGMIVDSKSGRNALLAWEEYQEGKLILEARPMIITGALTTVCNINCQSCSQNRARILGIRLRDEVESEIIELSDTLVELVWNGGEALATQNHRRFVDNFKRDNNPNLHLLTNTNGMLLNADVLKKYGEFTRVSIDISMDSFSKATFELIRTGASYEKVRENMHRAVESTGAMNVTISILLQKDNILELPNTIAYAVEHDIALSFAMLIEFPYHKRIDMFEDMPKDSAGWLEALDRAIAIGDVTPEARAKLLRFSSPEHALVGAKSVVTEAIRRYSEVREFSFRLENAGALGGMPCPGLAVGYFTGSRQYIPYALREHMRNERFTPIFISNIVGYTLLDTEKCDYLLRVPAVCGNDELYVAFFPDMFTPEIPLLVDALADGMTMLAPEVTVYNTTEYRKRLAGKMDRHVITGDYGSSEYAEWYRNAIKKFIVFP